jgi:hypothetical protein
MSEQQRSRYLAPLELSRTIENARPNLTSLRICSGSNAPLEHDEPPKGWSSWYPLTLTDLAIEKRALLSPLLAKHISLLPNLNRLEIHSCIRTRYEANSYEDKVKTMSIMSGVQNLVCTTDTLPALVPLFPNIRSLTIRMSIWTVVPEDITDLRLLVEEACLDLEEVILLSVQINIKGSEAARRKAMKKVKKIEKSWNKVRTVCED